MGELMRQYWIPAAMSRELRSEDAPMRLMLLGERLIVARRSFDAAQTPLRPEVIRALDDSGQPPTHGRRTVTLG